MRGEFPAQNCPLIAIEWSRSSHIKPFSIVRQIGILLLYDFQGRSSRDAGWTYLGVAEWKIRRLQRRQNIGGNIQKKHFLVHPKVAPKKRQKDPGGPFSGSSPGRLRLFQIR